MTENRFKKSVENATVNTTENILTDIEENIKTTVQESIQINTKDNIGKNILQKVSQKEKKEKGSNHTIYLSFEVGAELKKLMKKTSKSKSTLVDEILKAVFFYK